MKNSTTIVTALYDIGREGIDAAFRRSFDSYKECFARLLKVETPMVVFCDKSLEGFVRKERGGLPLRIVIKPKEEFKTKFPFWDQVQKIRKNKEWKTQASWLEHSPQSSLEYYNPIVMSKQFLLNDSAILNPFNTNYFFWVDAGISNTVGNPTQWFNNDMFDKITIGLQNRMLFLAYPYDGKHEVHGFKKNAMDNFSSEVTNRVLRGGFFWGRQSCNPCLQLGVLFFTIFNT